MNTIDDALKFHQTALGLRAQRQEVLASNIANADTPGFKARDFDFGATLKAAMGGRLGQGVGMDRTSSRHIGAANASELGPYLQYRRELQPSADGNTVDLDQERGAFAENALHYEASLTFISGLIRSMQTAINGQ